MRRTPIGVDTFDHKLDLLVFPSGGYEWKDEDELEAAALGLLDAEAVRAEARRVLREWPFPTGWEDWPPGSRLAGAATCPRAGKVWSRGDHVVVRYVRSGRAAWVRPVTVVEDTDTSNVLFLCADTPTKEPVRLRRQPDPARHGVRGAARARLEAWRRQLGARTRRC